MFCLSSLGHVWESDLGGIYEIALRIRFGRRSAPEIKGVLTFPSGSVCPVWDTSGRAIWEGSGRSFGGSLLGDVCDQISSSMFFPLGTVCLVWETSGRAIWERSGTDLGDRSGESLLGGEIAAYLRVSSFKWVLFA